MYLTPIAPIDFAGNIDDDLLQKAEDVCIKSAQLVSSCSPAVAKEIKNLLRIINSYYSNRIESEGTHPISIEKAMRKEYSNDSKEKSNQNLSIAYIETQKIIDELDFEKSKPFSSEFAKFIHSKFYSFDGMEDYLNIEYNDEIVRMTPGTFRDRYVKIGKHIPLEHTNIAAAFNEYNKLYENGTKFGTQAKKLIHILSSHHRFVWLHPFLDGNGRTARLILDSLFRYKNIEGYGLWNISRGLARDNKGYKDMLALADAPRMGGADGRGELSNSQLKQYVNYMLDICLDQVNYMRNQIKLDTLENRIFVFMDNLSKGMYNIEPLPKYTDLLFKELLLKGEVERKAVEEIIGTKYRTANYLIKELEARDFITSDRPRSAIRLKFNTYFAMKIFPELIPEV